MSQRSRHSTAPAEPAVAQLSSRALRWEIGQRCLALAGESRVKATCDELPAVLFDASGDGAHGNFLKASYQRICVSADWKRRLNKRYSAFRRLPRSSERTYRELDCANSSDALLMNIFCYPGITSRKPLCALLGTDRGLRPRFGVRPRTPLVDGHADRSEIDMALGDLFVEAKLTESGFQGARPDLVYRYKQLDDTFNVDDLPRSGVAFAGYQVVRGVLAAQHSGTSFMLLCDHRRPELIEVFYRVVRAVRDCELRSRLAVLTWQELAVTLPKTMQAFLSNKYGIDAGRLR